MPPRRRRRDDGNAGLRAWIAEQERELYGGLHAELDKTADALASGREVLVYRYQLPDDHPERWAGGNVDTLVLGVDDVLRSGPAATES